MAMDSDQRTRHPRHQVERRQDAIGKLGREVALVQQAGNEEVTLGGKCKQDAQPGVGQQTGGQLQRRVQVLRHGRAHTVNAFTVGFQRSSIYSTSSADFSTSAVSSSR